MKPHRKKIYLLSLFLGLSAFAADFDTSAQLTTQGAYTRFELALDPSFQPKLTLQGKKFNLIIPNASYLDLGVPLGEEQAFLKHLLQLKDDRVQFEKVSAKKDGIEIQGQFLFPKGQKKLAKELMEAFDFKRAEQGKYVIDFWYQKGPTQVEQVILNRKNQADTVAKMRAEFLKRENERKAARDKRIQESMNALSFCEQPFDRTQTVFVRFSAEHPIFSFDSYFPELIPDHRFEYTEPKGHSEEAKMVRLALKLNRENQQGLVVKTVEFLEKNYPKSKFLPEMRFLRANAFYRLDLKEKGREEIQHIAKTERGSDVALHSAAYLAIQSLNQKQWLQALESFNTLLRDYPKNSYRWLFHYGVAESLFEIRQLERAEEAYDAVEKLAPKDSIKAEAAFKKGDLYFARNQFARSLQTYLEAMKKHENQLAAYPYVLLNLGESFFQLEEYKRSTAEFQKFLKLSPSHPSAWKASLRLAELKSLFHAHTTESEVAFTETVNRYPMSPGAVIARLRLLPCGNHGGFDLKGMVRFLESTEVKRYEDYPGISSSAYRELLALTEVRSLLSFGADESAIEQGINRLRQNPSVDVRRMIERTMIAGIKRILSGQLKKADFVGALGTFEKYGDYLPLPSHDPHVDDLRLQIAHYASEHGLKTVALKIVEPYRQLSDSSEMPLLSQIEKSLRLETTQMVEDRALLEAKTLWNGSLETAKTRDEFSRFEKLLSQLKDPTPFSIERDALRALSEIQLKETDRLKLTADSLKAEWSKGKLEDQVVVAATLADYFRKEGEWGLASEWYQLARKAKMAQKEGKTDTSLNYRGLVRQVSAATLVADEGEMYERQNFWTEAIALYAMAVENKIGGNRILFAHAKALLKDGKEPSRKSAQAVLKKIEESPETDVWKTLAQKALNDMAKEGPKNGKTQP